MNGRRILLVEDDEFVRSLVETQLEMLGYEVMSAVDATRALSALAAGTPVDLPMTDVTMPGELDGFGLAARVRARWPALPILFASGSVHDGADARALGAPHLRKPYRLDELERKLAEALATAPRGNA